MTKTIILYKGFGALLAKLKIIINAEKANTIIVALKITCVVLIIYFFFMPLYLQSRHYCTDDLSTFLTN